MTPAGPRGLRGGPAKPGRTSPSSINVASGTEGPPSHLPGSHRPPGRRRFVGGGLGSSLNSSYPDPNGNVVGTSTSTSQQVQHGRDSRSDLRCTETGVYPGRLASTTNPGRTRPAHGQLPGGHERARGGAKASCSGRQRQHQQLLVVSPTQLQVTCPTPAHQRVVHGLTPSARTRLTATTSSSAEHDPEPGQPEPGGGGLRSGDEAMGGGVPPAPRIRR